MFMQNFHENEIHAVIKKALAQNHFIEEAEIDSLIQPGLIACISQQFLLDIAHNVGSRAAKITLEFFTNFLGKFTYAVQETTQKTYSLSYITPQNMQEPSVSDPVQSIDGVMLRFIWVREERKYLAQLIRIVTVRGLVTQDIIQTYQI